MKIKITDKTLVRQLPGLNLDSVLDAQDSRYVPDCAVVKLSELQKKGADTKIFSNNLLLVSTQYAEQ